METCRMESEELQILQSKVHVALDAHVGSVNVGTINRHFHVGSPRTVLPLNIEAVVGLECGSQGAIIPQTPLPFDRNVSVAVESGSNTVVVINLLGECQLLGISGGSELDVGLVLAVGGYNVSRVVFEVEARRYGNASAISIEALGGLHAPDLEVVSSTGDEMDGKVSIVIASVNLELRAVSRLSIDLGTSGDSVRLSKG